MHGFFFCKPINEKYNVVVYGLHGKVIFVGFNNVDVYGVEKILLM
jgi:hypothetical protein